MMARTILYTHDDFGGHETPPGHVEHSGRFHAVSKALSGEAFAPLIRRDAPRASLDLVEAVHGTALVSAMDAARPSAPRNTETFKASQAPSLEDAPNLVQIDGDTFMGPTSFDAALRAAGAAAAGVDAVFNGEAQNAFVAARPPGHHAEPGRPMGFCLFNSIAIAAMHARAAHGAARVAVVDFDVHHGNGTQAAFWDDEGAFFASSHEWPQYPGTGADEERGAFDNICNAPIASGEGGAAFQRAWGRRLLPALSDFDPDVILISAGFDAHGADPLGGLRLTEADFAWVSAEIISVAKDKCDGRVVSLLEGGYDLTALGRCVATHLRALMAA